MKKVFKSLNCQIKKFNDKYKYWWVICIYLFVPAFLILFFDKTVTPRLQNYMIGAKVNEITISNSEYAIENVINPFVNSMLIIIAFIISYIILWILQKKLLKNKIYFVGARKCVKFIETVTILLAIIIAVYGKTTSFDYSRYGCSVDTIKEYIIQAESASHIPLEEIPTIHSTGIIIEDKISPYNILINVSQLGYCLSDNLKMIIAIAGAIIIPLKSYCEEIEKYMRSKDNNRNRRRK